MLKFYLYSTRGSCYLQLPPLFYLFILKDCCHLSCVHLPLSTYFLFLSFFLACCYGFFSTALARYMYTRLEVAMTSLGCQNWLQSRVVDYMTLLCYRTNLSGYISLSLRRIFSLQLLTTLDGAKGSRHVSRNKVTHAQKRFCEREQT